MKIRRLCFLVLLCAIIPLPLSAFDWGLLTDQNAVYEDTRETGKNNADKMSYQASFIPWFSSSQGENWDVYFSAGVSVKYEENKGRAAPELFRTEFTYRFGEAKIRAGRMQYADPLGFIANGLFDGAYGSLDTALGVFGAGLWYTGLLYKKTAHITMTKEDQTSYDDGFNWGNFKDSYFSSRRLVMALDWEHPGIAELVRIKFAFINQVDLNKRDTKYHSQYFTGRASLPIENFVIGVGGSLETAELPGTGEKTHAALAGEMDVAWFLPTEMEDRLMLQGRIASGKSGSMHPFVPFTTEPQGGVLKAKLSGLSIICLSYNARLHQTISLFAESSYFIMSDSETYIGLPKGRDGRCLGAELYGKLTWAPVSDARLNFGGGFFFPSMGNAEPDGKPQWKAELNLVFAL